MVSQQVPANATKEMLEEFEARKDEINDRIIDVLRPEILKLKELMVFVGSFVVVVKNCLQLLASTESKGKTVPEGVYTAFLDAIDLVVKLDTLKDSKSSLSNDFSRYKRSIQLQSRKMSASDMTQINEEMTQLQMFLVNPDPRKAKNFIYLTLREEVKKVSGHEDVLIDLLEYALESTEKNMFMTPDEKHRALRVVPFLMLLIDGEAADPRSLNVFTTKKLNIPSLQQLFNKHPVLPLYADMTITVIYIFERSPHFDRGEVAKLWGDDLPVKTAAEYNVASHWERIKTSFNSYSTNLLCVLRNIDHFEFVKSADKENIARIRIVYEIVKDGLGFIAEWNGVLSRVMAWKFTHPCPQEHLDKIGADQSGAGFEYERLVKYNFTKTELTKFVDIMSMIKSLSGILDRAKLKLATIIRFHIHHQVQQLVQGTLLPILHRMDKRKKDSFAGLLRLRQMTADWVDGIEPIEDYKVYSRKLGQIDAVHPARVVGPTYVQLQLLRSELLAIYDEKSLARKRSGLFGKSDLEKEDITELEQFYTDSFYFPYMLDFSGTLREVSDLSYLWYRELYLEATRCTQFPIDMSLPWLLTEHVISNQSGVLPIIENVFYTLDVYNDAAYRALFVLNQQFLYDEIEAETNLVFDQFVFLLSEELFAHYKDVAAYMILDKDFKDKLELNGILNFKLSKRRYDIPVLQRRVQLLGRSIDLNFLICQV
jgi:cytoplasmic FMR1 interacting protein